MYCILTFTSLEILCGYCNSQRRKVYDGLLSCMKPARIWDLYAFKSGPFKYSNTDPKVRLLNEYFRLLGKSSLWASMSMIEDGSFTLSNELWRITNINSSYALCQSYPFALVVPKHIRYCFLIQDFPALIFLFLLRYFETSLFLLKLLEIEKASFLFFDFF